MSLMHCACVQFRNWWCLTKLQHLQQSQIKICYRCWFWISRLLCRRPCQHGKDHWKFTKSLHHVIRMRNPYVVFLMTTNRTGDFAILMWLLLHKKGSIWKCFTRKSWCCATVWIGCLYKAAIVTVCSQGTSTKIRSLNASISSNYVHASFWWLCIPLRKKLTQHHSGSKRSSIFLPPLPKCWNSMCSFHIESINIATAPWGCTVFSIVCCHIFHAFSRPESKSTCPTFHYDEVFAVGL